ncbi:hypothetical protein BJ322DRAFT_1110147 [Thelephora terrestris]|uniref:F-box domain-containing protein n=1 Tax=Thelephora terrestris TaxID=56493 RepID=A0A9P6HB30_9AGAM|nr:hypothetical protein BJ322DRAFT_1110147 [Thelephora terrestris]
MGGPQEVLQSPYQVSSESSPCFPHTIRASPHQLTLGIEIFANAVWRRSKAKLMGGLAHKHSDPPTDLPQRRSFPPEIVEMIIAHLKYDTATLKSCAATCFTWYRIAVPHVHRTLMLREWTSSKFGNQPSNPLLSSFKYGLLPFVEQLDFRGTFAPGHWDVPAVFDSRNMRYFRAMVNLQELKIGDLDFSKFPVGLGKYLGHFAPTLRSVALSWPKGTRRQLLDFFRLFPKLEDVEILCYDPKRSVSEPLDNQLVPISGGLRGRLTLNMFNEVGLLEDIAVAFGGMRFTSMDLRGTRRVMRFVLNACAHTLEILRIYPQDVFDPVSSRTHEFNLSSNTALRSIEVPDSSLIYSTEFLSTITSPVFSEIVVIFPESGASCTWETLARVMHSLYEIRGFSVVFCLEGSETSRAEGQRELTVETEKAVAAGLYDFLPHPPLVFFRAIANRIRQYSG